jgi:ferredoxin-NADP reductase
MAGTALRRRLTWQAAKISAVTAETASVRTIALDVPDWPGHQAGQHLDIRLTDEDGYVAERSYSIASAPSEPVAITVERLDDGRSRHTSPTSSAPGTTWSCAGRSAATHLDA